MDRWVGSGWVVSIGLDLEEFLGHVGATTLVDDVRDSEDDLEGDDEEDEEAHAGSGRGDHCG